MIMVTNFICVHLKFHVNLYCSKSEERLQWMYKGDKPEMDDYLLGKRIDRHIEKDEKPVGMINLFKREATLS